MNTENPCFKIRRGVNSNPSPMDNLRLEPNPKGFLMLPYHHLELVTFESGDGQDTLTLSFLNRTVRIKGKNLRDLGLALQDRCVEFVRSLPTLDRYSSLAGTEASVKTIEITDNKEQVDLFCRSSDCISLLYMGCTFCGQTRPNTGNAEIEKNL